MPLSPTASPVEPQALRGGSRRLPGTTIRLWLAAVVALFLLAHLPGLGSPSRYHHDEQFYTDAAIDMVQGGDWLTPRTAEGEPRFQKPVLTYWGVAVPFRLFGIGFFTARLTSLLAAAGILVVTYFLGRDLFGDRRTGLLGAVVLLGNNELYNAALRATPDALQTFFLAAAFLGLLRLLKGSGASRDAYLAYAGAGMAVAVKGLLGLGLVVVVWIYAAFALGGVAAYRRLFHGPALGAGGLLAGWWFGAVWAVHGDAVWAGFLGDQVGIRVGAPPGEMLSHLVAYLWVPLRDFLPWTLFLAVSIPADGRGSAALWRAHRRDLGLIVVWILFLVAVFSAANLFKTRYLLPGYPAVAAVAGAFLARPLATRIPRGHIRWTPAVAVGLGAAGAILLMVIGAAVSPRMLVGGAVWLAGSAAVGPAILRPRSLPTALAVSAYALLVFSVYDGFVRPVFGTPPSVGLARRLSELSPAAAHRVEALGIESKFLSQIRVLTGGRVRPREVDGPSSIDPRATLLVHPRRREEIRGLGRPAGEAVVYSRSVRAHQIEAAVRGANADSVFASTRRAIWIVPPATGDP